MAARLRVVKPDDEAPSRRPATTPEALENELISDAMTLAQRQINDGTASSQVITHFLKLGSSREKLEQQRLEHENELLQVKKDAIEAQQRIEELYVDAIKAMRSYAGDTPEDDDNDEDYAEG